MIRFMPLLCLDIYILANSGHSSRTFIADFEQNSEVYCRHEIFFQKPDFSFVKITSATLLVLTC